MGIFKSLNQTTDKALEVGEVYYKKTQEYYQLKIFKQVAYLTGMFCKLLLVGSFLFLGLILAIVLGNLTQIILPMVLTDGLDVPMDQDFIEMSSDGRCLHQFVVRSAHP